MALKPCRECKVMVSTGAKTCPHCGVSSPTGMPSATGAGCLIAAVGILALFAIGWIMEPHPSTEPAASGDSQSAAPAQHEKPIDLSRPIVTAQVPRGRSSQTEVCDQALGVAGQCHEDIPTLLFGC
jgi:hypothetical protein